MAKKRRKPTHTRPSNQAEGFDLDSAAEARYNREKFLIVCGFVGIPIIDESDRHNVLSTVNLRHLVSTVAELNRAFDVAWTTPLGWGPQIDRMSDVERVFLFDAHEHWVERVRRRLDQGHRLVAPRAAAQLIREAIEHASTGEDAPTIDKSTLVRLLLSINSEQNMRPEFNSDVPTRKERQRHSAVVSSFDLDQAQAANAAQLPDTIATSLFNDPVKLHMVLANTHDAWFRPWSLRTKKTAGLGSTPLETFGSANGVQLLEVLRLGTIVSHRSSTVMQSQFRRDELVELGASPDSVNLMFTEMTLSIDEFRRLFQQERAAGPVGHQRFNFTRYPFLKVDADTCIMLRQAWALDKLCGIHLFFQTWSRLEELHSREVADTFRTAMNDIFEETVGGILRRASLNSNKIRTIVSEDEMQEQWAANPANKPRVCDWALLADDHCIVVDATNSPVPAKLAQGLASVADYERDVTKVFTDNKFDQLVKTIDRLRTEGGINGFTVDDDTTYIPLVVVPDAGMPSSPNIEVDLMHRSRPIFEHLQPHVLPPGVIQLSDLQLLEGVADYHPVDMLELTFGWRHAAAKNGIPLQVYVTGRGYELPLSKHMQRAYRQIAALLKDAE